MALLDFARMCLEDKYEDTVSPPLSREKGADDEEIWSECVEDPRELIPSPIHRCSEDSSAQYSEHSYNTAISRRESDQPINCRFGREPSEYCEDTPTNNSEVDVSRSNYSSRCGTPVPQLMPVHIPQPEMLLPSRSAGFWADASASQSFQVRGPNYMRDGRKIPAGPAVCLLLWFDIFSVTSSPTGSVEHICSQGACAARVRHLTSLPGGYPFLFVTAIQVPGSPLLYLVMYWGVNMSQLNPNAGACAGDKACSNLLQRYIDLPQTDDTPTVSPLDKNPSPDPLTNVGGTWSQTQTPTVTPSVTSRKSQDWSPTKLPRASLAAVNAFQNSRFKLIPEIVSGPWMVKRLVGSVPCLLGTKVTQRYYRGPNYIETNVEVGSSSVAHHVIGCCRGCSNKIDVILGIVLQGEDERTELPERLLGAIQLSWLTVDDPALQTPLYG